MRFVSVRMVCSYNHVVLHIAVSLVCHKVPKLNLSLDSCASWLDQYITTSGPLFAADNKFLDVVQRVIKMNDNYERLKSIQALLVNRICRVC